MAHSKVPLLTLKLSSQSFLDSEIRDDLNTHPLYTITTTDTLTTVSRHDQWGASFAAAEIKWPKERPVKGKGKAKDTDGVLVQMRGGRWKGGDAFLRPSTFTSTRSFNIPKYSQALKWRLAGSSYCCTTAGVKGPIAMFEAVANPIPACIKVYETLTDKDDPSALDTHRGVSTLLLDYFVITALLLTTDVQEWMGVQRFEGDRDARSSTSSSPQSLSTASNSASAFQWRKIMYGEPIFPKRSRTVTSQVRPGGSTTSPGQMAKLAYGIPIYPALRNASSSFFSDSESEDEPEGESARNITDGDIRYEAVTAPSRPPSPSAESLYFPQSTSSAPSHTYLDPSFYDFQPPPVPPLPSHYQRSGVPQSPSSTTQNDQDYRPSLSLDGSTSSENSKQLVSVSSRPLPTPPVLARTPHSSTHSLRHTRSPDSPAHPTSHNRDNRQSRYATPRSLPPTPISSSAVRVEHIPYPSLPSTRFVQPNYDQPQHTHHKPEDQNSFIEWTVPFNRGPQNDIIDAPPSYNSLFGGNFS